MLNAESRKYFNRAYSSSGAVSGFHLRRDNHVEHLQQCLQINETAYGFAEMLKTANTTALAACNYLRWLIYMESPNTPGAFMTQTLDEIYNSDSAPKMDAMFSIATQVFRCIHFPNSIYSIRSFSSIGSHTNFPRYIDMGRTTYSRSID